MERPRKKTRVAAKCFAGLTNFPRVIEHIIGQYALFLPCDLEVQRHEPPRGDKDSLFCASKGDVLVTGPTSVSRLTDATYRGTLITTVSSLTEVDWPRYKTLQTITGDRLFLSEVREGVEEYKLFGPDDPLDPLCVGTWKWVNSHMDIKVCSALTSNESYLHGSLGWSSNV
jgi:hypothetical protein